MGSQARAMVWVELLTLVAFSPCLQGQVMPELPNPRMIIVGPTGAGKSSLANAFLGCDPRAPDGTCLFGVCNGMDSCTKETTYGYGPWLGTTPHDFTVVDTPGFGDSDGEDEQLIEEMMGVLSNTISKADTIVLLLNGVSSQRFTDSLVTMIKRMTVMFGQQWWDYLVIGVSFWSYSEEGIAGRRPPTTSATRFSNSTGKRRRASCGTSRSTGRRSSYSRRLTTYSRKMQSNARRSSG